MRRLLALVVGALGWTALVMYPNPAVLFRNFARYRHLPLDPDIEKRMGWDLPDDPAGIEFTVDSFILPAPDWKVYRVPWYVPTASEAAVATHGDCETKTVLLASLLEGRKIPYTIRVSFGHIWVEYAGRKAGPGESKDIAFAERRNGRTRFGWPQRVPWREVLRTQREQLWDPMPLARKGLWLLGLLWVSAGAVVLAGPAPEGELVSQWRTPLGSYLAAAFWLSSACFVAFVLLQTRLGSREPARWQPADVHEALALAALSGLLLAWLRVVRPTLAVTIALDEPRLRLAARLGVWRRESSLGTPEVDHFGLLASPGGLRAWLVYAGLRNGQRVALLRHSRETAARAALQRLGSQLARAVVVRADGREYWTAPDEIGLNVRERAARRPEQPPLERPPDCYLTETRTEAGWTLGYPRPGRGASRPLLVLVGVVFVAVAGTTALLAWLPGSTVVRVIWVGVAVLAGMAVYGGMSLREEILATLSGARLQIADGEVTFHDSDGKVRSVPLDDVESVEIGRQGETPTIAIVSPERVIHVRLFPQPKHLEWVRSEVERAIAGSGR